MSHHSLLVRVAAIQQAPGVTYTVDANDKNGWRDTIITVPDRGAIGVVFARPDLDSVSGEKQAMYWTKSSEQIITLQQRLFSQASAIEDGSSYIVRDPAYSNVFQLMVIPRVAYLGKTLAFDQVVVALGELVDRSQPDEPRVYGAKRLLVDSEHGGSFGRSLLNDNNFAPYDKNEGGCKGELLIHDAITRQVSMMMGDYGQ